ncbi:MFS transporter [Oerskovia flava]|uniref:MFS transporter n=1 Tax=Oerskovia flava TaxID=2986422 RepID=UPI002240972C|nr:MFS transporter [Oerskovia sp. JB1-3-2]
MPTDLAVRRARRSLLGLFGVIGLTFTSWLSRLPSIRADLGLGSAELGALLVVGAVGALCSVLVAGALVVRFGNRRLLVAATAANVAGFALVAVATATGNPALFAAGAFLNGVSGAAANVPINLNAAFVEQRVGRAILPHFHAAFSIGAALGTLVGAGFSWAQVPVSVHVLAVAVVGAAVRLVLIRPATAFAPEVLAAAHEGEVGSGAGTRASDGSSAPTPRRGGMRTALGAWRERRTVLLGLVLLAASLSEGSASTWMAIAVVDGFAEREAVGALAYGTFITSMTVFRLLGTRLIDRFGRVAVLRASAGATLGGLLLFGLAPVLPVAWLGIVAWGCGAALGNPIAVAAASDDPLHAPGRVSVVTSFASVAQLSAPPLLGLLADSVGAREALLTICVAAVLGFALAGQVRPLRSPSD